MKAAKETLMDKPPPLSPKSFAPTTVQMGGRKRRYCLLNLFTNNRRCVRLLVCKNHAETTYARKPIPILLSPCRPMPPLGNRAGRSGLLAADLVGYWSFDGCDGKIAKDLSGGGHDCHRLGRAAKEKGTHSSWTASTRTCAST